MKLKTEKSPLKAGGKMASGNKQVFVVDDDESVCRALKILLVTYGFEVQTFASAEKFLNSVQHLGPGCLILDVHMPGMDGFALQQRLNEDGFRFPVIFISVNKNLKSAEQYLKAPGTAGVLQKPFNDQELVDLIEAAFKKNKKILIRRKIK
ncbi:MAG: response regulator [Candidatus Aureabacteria bacterium]|nr:response regulator [Candidatus Auribacterota bacterium]